MSRYRYRTSPSTDPPYSKGALVWKTIGRRRIYSVIDEVDDSEAVLQKNVNKTIYTIVRVIDSDGNKAKGRKKNLYTHNQVYTDFQVWDRAKFSEFIKLEREMTDKIEKEVLAVIP